MPAHSVAAVPVYRWRGAQPFPLELGEADTGTAICLLLHREGDVCLVPISWQANVPPVARTHLNFRADALDGEALRLTLAELEGEGWAVIGRLEVHFPAGSPWMSSGPRRWPESGNHRATIARRPAPTTFYPTVS